MKESRIIHFFSKQSFVLKILCKSDHEYDNVIFEENAIDRPDME